MTIAKKKPALNGVKKAAKKSSVHPLEALRLLAQKAVKREGVELKPFKR